jgi:hypothetical protein
MVEERRVTEGKGTNGTESGDDGAGSDALRRAKAEVAARLALLQARYGEVFSSEGEAVARAAIEGAVARDARLRRVRLGNADEPVGPFAPARGRREGDGS